MSQIFVPSFNPALTVLGLQAPAAKMAFYLSGTNTLATVYDENGDPLSQAPNGFGTVGVAADITGRFPQIYLGDEDAYRVVLRTAEGAQIGNEVDPYTNLEQLLDNFIASLSDPATAGLIGASHAETYPNNTLGEKFKQAISVKDAPFDAKGDGSTDDTSAFQAAATYAIANGYAALYVPACSVAYKITATVNLGRLKLFGDGLASSIIRPTISDGSAVFSFAAGTNFFEIDGIQIDSGIDQANFISGAINGLNCVGIKINSSSPDFSARYAMRNVLVRGLKTGYNINGFLGTLGNIWASICETGLIGNIMNSTRAHLRFNSCRKDFAITDSNGLHLDQLCSEGGVLQSGILTSTIDDVNGLKITAPYFEQVRDAPFITFGGTTECKSVTIDGISVAMQDNASSDYNTYPLAFDRVNGLDIKGYFSTGAHRKAYSTTSNTKNVVDESVSEITSWAPNDASKNLNRVYNYFPNSNFDMWFRGWPNVAYARATGAKETTIVRRGLNALKVTADSGQTNGNVQFLFSDGYLASKLAGKTVCVYAWVWIPDLAIYDPNDRLVQTYLSINCNGTGGGTTDSSATAAAKGAWNLFKVSRTIASDATTMQVQFSLLRATGTTDGTEYAVIDSIFIVEGSGQDVAVRNGWVVDSACIQGIGIGGRMLMFTDTVPSDPDQTYESGDQVRKLTLTAGASPGWNCTTGGVGGVAVFTAKANDA